MYPQTLYPETKQILKQLSGRSFQQDFYLAGGTALALQLGHRKSIDLDFFSTNFPKEQILLQNLSDLKPSVAQQTKGTLDLLLNEVKVSFLEYKYPLVQEFTKYEGAKLASVMDILCMKLTAISSRGTKKDFYDLYFGLQKYSLQEIWENFEQKYKDTKYQKLHILKSLTYFTDAERDPQPDLLKNVSWDEVKSQITKLALGKFI